MRVAVLTLRRAVYPLSTFPQSLRGYREPKPFFSLVDKLLSTSHGITFDITLLVLSLGFTVMSQLLQ